MPRLFISYKRNTDGVEKLKNDLRAARYALWFDRDDIPLGSPDWQAEIETALRDQCADAGVPFFLKQWGGKTADAGGHLLDGEVIQEFPTL